MIRVSLLHPSRGRPVLAFKAFDEWISMADNPKEIEYIMVLDDDDPTIPIYMEELAKVDQSKVGKLVFHIGETRFLIAAFHKASLLMGDTSELIIGVSDDMGSAQGWDTLLFGILKSYDNFKDPKFIGVNDGLQHFGAMLYLIINRAWYTRVSHVIYPEYTGCYADDDMRETAKRLNSVIEAPQILFQHRHYSLGMTPHDSTYVRHNNSASVAKNLAIYEARAARNFDII